MKILNISGALATGLLSIWAITVSSAGAQAPAPIQTVHSAKVPVAGARTQPCYADSCANRGEVAIACPAGTQYVATHYFTNASYPNDVSDVYETGLQEISWAHFAAASVQLNQLNQAVVTVYYYNRSNRNRVIALNVDCQ